MSKIRFGELLAYFDDGIFKKGRVKGINKETTDTIFSPYGYLFHPPKGSLCLSIPIQGKESNRVSIVDNPVRRPLPLEEGECGIANFLTGTLIILKKDGSILIDSVDDINVNATGHINITASSADVTTSGEIKVTSDTKITLKAPTIILDGDTEIKGDVLNDGINISKTHIHPQGSDSNGDSQVDTGTPQ